VPVPVGVVCAEDEVIMSRIAATAIATLTLYAALAAAPAGSTGGPFQAFVGSWNGNGQVRLQDGRSEQIKCLAFFTDRAPGLGIALRCASSGSKIDLRAQLTGDGKSVSGRWEERQFNANGSLTGTQAGGKLTLQMDGGGLKATVVATVTGAAQTFVISTDAGTVRGAQISLTKTADQ
jgi:hypothetical protein